MRPCISFATMNKNPFVEALRKSVEILGSQAAAARAVGVNQATISRWLAGRVQWAPHDLPASLERATEGKVKAKEFYP